MNDWDTDDFCPTPTEDNTDARAFVRALVIIVLTGVLMVGGALWFLGHALYEYAQHH